MHVSIDVLVEALEERGEARAESPACEERLGISSVTMSCHSVGESTLLVADGEAVARLEALPHHLLVVLAPDEPTPTLNALGLAFIRTKLSVAEVFASICDAMLALSNWDSRVLEAIAARQDVSAVLAIAAERLTNPIALFDSKGALVSYAGTLTQSAEHTIWEDVLLNRYTPIEYYTHDEQLRLARDMHRRWPVVYSPERDRAHRYLTRGLIVDGKLTGTIGMVDVNAPITRGQVALAELVSDRLQLALSMRLASGAVENDTAYLLRSVLNGNKADRGLVSYHMERLGWGPDPTFWLMACETTDSEGESFADATRLGRMSRLLDHALCIQYERRIVALVANHDPCACEGLPELLQKLDMRAVVSAPFVEIAAARLAYDQCDLGLRATANGEPATTPTPFPELFDQALVHAINPGLNLRALCDQTVLALAERGYGGDVERGRALVRELHVYLMNGCNALLTARQLYLHRNTLLYHISQVEDLLGMQLADLGASRRLALVFSCLVALSGTLP